MSCGTKAGAAGMLKNTGSELKERLGDVCHRLIPGSAQPWTASANTPANASAGVVEVVATGEPLTMGYCHCTSCRQWSASPVNAFTIWVPEAIRITKGVESVGSFLKTKKTVR